MATITLTSEEYAALVADRDALRGECDGLRGEVRTLKVEVSLLEERLKAHLRKLFDAKSEARGSEQQDMFFNEVEMLAPAGTPVAEETTVGQKPLKMGLSSTFPSEGGNWFGFLKLHVCIRLLRTLPLSCR